jgi:hypothetical protein
MDGTQFPVTVDQQVVVEGQKDIVLVRNVLFCRYPLASIRYTENNVAPTLMGIVMQKF